MEKFNPTEKDELELSIRDGKLKITLNGLEIQKYVYRIEYQHCNPSGTVCSSVEMHLIVPIL